MTSGVNPASITAAAMATQFFILVIVFVGTILVRSTEPRVSVYVGTKGMQDHLWFQFIFALITMGTLVFSDQFSSFWKPVFGSSTFHIMGWSTALLVVLSFDIIYACVIVGQTGGSTISPFTPLYFILPPLAIFLRESPGRILFYTLLVAILFSLNLIVTFKEQQSEGERVPTLAYWFVSIASFSLATFVGYITRPH
ncbi:MAG: hypothetical protein ACRD4H_04075 [Candidatus Acidiferrales bacterium]